MTRHEAEHDGVRLTRTTNRAHTHVAVGCTRLGRGEPRTGMGGARLVRPPSGPRRSRAGTTEAGPATTPAEEERATARGAADARGEEPLRLLQAQAEDRQPHHAALRALLRAQAGAQGLWPEDLHRLSRSLAMISARVTSLFSATISRTWSSIVPVACR